MISAVKPALVDSKSSVTADLQKTPYYSTVDKREANYDRKQVGFDWLREELSRSLRLQEGLTDRRHDWFSHFRARFDLFEAKSVHFQKSKRNEKTSVAQFAKNKPIELKKTDSSVITVAVPVRIWPKSLTLRKYPVSDFALVSVHSITIICHKDSPPLQQCYSVVNMKIYQPIIYNTSESIHTSEFII